MSMGLCIGCNVDSCRVRVGSPFERCTVCLHVHHVGETSPASLTRLCLPHAASLRDLWNHATSTRAHRLGPGYPLCRDSCACRNRCLNQPSCAFSPFVSVRARHGRLCLPCPPLRNRGEVCACAGWLPAFIEAWETVLSGVCGAVQAGLWPILVMRMCRAHMSCTCHPAGQCYLLVAVQWVWWVWRVAPLARSTPPSRAHPSFGGKKPCAVSRLFSLSEGASKNA